VGAVTPPSNARGAIDLGPLPDTPSIRRQKADLRHRYAAFFQQRGLTPAQEDRFIELKVHLAIEREDFQAAVRAANLRGDSDAVQTLRMKDVAPINQELYEMLGREGYEASVAFGISSGYRVAYVEPLLPAFVSARVPLSPQQAEQLLPVFAANSRRVQADRTDIGTTGTMDWPGVIAQSGGILTPEQLAVLQAYVQRLTPAPHTH